MKTLNKKYLAATVKLDMAKDKLLSNFNFTDSQRGWAAIEYIAGGIVMAGIMTFVVGALRDNFIKEIEKIFK